MKTNRRQAALPAFPQLTERLVLPHLLYKQKWQRALEFSLQVMVLHTHHYQWGKASSVTRLQRFTDSKRMIRLRKKKKSSYLVLGITKDKVTWKCVILV